MCLKIRHPEIDWIITISVLLRLSPICFPIFLGQFQWNLGPPRAQLCGIHLGFPWRYLPSTENSWWLADEHIDPLWTLFTLWLWRSHVFHDWPMNLWILDDSCWIPQSCYLPPTCTDADPCGSGITRMTSSFHVNKSMERVQHRPRSTSFPCQPVCTWISGHISIVIGLKNQLLGIKQTMVIAF